MRIDKIQSTGMAQLEKIYCNRWSETRLHLSPLLFALVIDRIMSNVSMTLGVANGSHFDYTYDMVLLDTCHERMQIRKKTAENKGRKMRLYLNLNARKSKTVVSSDF